MIERNKSDFPIGTDVKVWVGLTSARKGCIQSWEGDYFTYESQNSLTLEWSTHTVHKNQIAYKID